MAQPSEKSTQVELLLEQLFGRSTAIKNDICVSCKGPATQFRDNLSRKEHSISGLCQGCQDAIFNCDADEFIG